MCNVVSKNNEIKWQGVCKLLYFFLFYSKQIGIIEYKLHENLNIR